MKKTKRIISAALAVLMLSMSALLCGCNVLNYNSTSANESLIHELESYSKKSGGETALIAHPYIQDVLSWEYSIQIEIKDGQVFLNDIPYDKVTYSKDLKIEYDNGITIQLENKDATVSETLEAIKQHKGCYLLETDSSSKFGKKIAVFLIDDEFYFVNFFDSGNVMRIHSTIVK